MLTIRNEQMQILENEVRLQFHQRLLALLRDNLPQRTKQYDDSEMLRRIAAADKKAGSYGITSERGIAKFVALSFLAGPNFDEGPKARRFLTYPRVEPHHKIDTLFDYLVERSQQAEGA